MRMGMSWPPGNGRREWISMGPLGWLLFGWIFVLAAMVWLTVQLAWLLCVILARVGPPLYRRAVEA